MSQMSSDSGPAMDRDGLLPAIETAQHAVEVAVRALTSYSEALERIRRQAGLGMPLPLIIDAHVRSGGVDMRHAAGAALDVYERAVMELRSEIVRQLVDDHGLTLTEVAGTIRVSRQMVARLLDAGRSGTSGAD